MALKVALVLPFVVGEEFTFGRQRGPPTRRRRFGICNEDDFDSSGDSVGIAGCTSREFPTGLTTSGDSDEDSGELIPSLQGNSGC